MPRRYERECPASPITVTSLARAMQFGDDPGNDLESHGVPTGLLDHLLFVVPANHLNGFRFHFVGEAIIDRLGLPLRGMSFGSLLDRYPSLRDCLVEFEQTRDAGLPVSSHRRLDFSPDWLIEYSRTIVPLFDRAGLRYLMAGYIFHDLMKRASVI